MKSKTSRYPFKLPKYCRNATHLIAFIGLLIPCYFLYMEDAIQKSKDRATTVTRQSQQEEYEVPTITICADPIVKKSVTKKYPLHQPPRFVFNDVGGQIFFENRTVQEVWDEFTYSKDFNIIYDGVDLHLGTNKINDTLVDVEFKIVPTLGLGACYVMIPTQSKGLQFLARNYFFFAFSYT